MLSNAISTHGLVVNKPAYSAMSNSLKWGKQGGTRTATTSVTPRSPLLGIFQLTNAIASVASPTRSIADADATALALTCVLCRGGGGGGGGIDPALMPWMGSGSPWEAWGHFPAVPRVP